MTHPFEPRPGAILSADIAVPDHEGLLHFYARVLCTGEPALWQGNLLNRLGLPVIGLGERDPANRHLPLQWMPHMLVADVALAVELALQHNGRLLLQAPVEQGTSAWAVLEDPNGAAFGIVSLSVARQHQSTTGLPADVTDVGRIAWADLTVANASATRDFYSEVIGWSVQPVAMKDSGQSYEDYAMLGVDGEALAGICHARGANRGLPPVWLIYLPVGDLQESLKRTEAEGGRIIKTITNAEGRCVHAVIRDPEGASVALSQN